MPRGGVPRKTCIFRHSSEMLHGSKPRHISSPTERKSFRFRDAPFTVCANIILVAFTFRTQDARPFKYVQPLKNASVFGMIGKMDGRPRRCRACPEGSKTNPLGPHYVGPKVR